jgi:4-amino-4-deoxy-L-arabinose transferase-like glycosyltransferase
MPHSKKSKPPLNAMVPLLAVVMLVHLALAIWYASITPWRTSGRVFGKVAQDIGAPDERQHVNYIARLANGGGFPVFNPKDPNLYESYQSHQPPAYYILAAGWAQALDARLGSLDNTAPLDMSGNALRMRSLNAAIGALGVAGVFFLALWGFGRSDVAIVAAAFAALLPMNVALSGAVSNDPMLICLCTWVLALLARGITSGWSVGLAILIGVSTGLALLTKTTAVALLPILLLAAVLPQKKRPKLGMALGIGAIVLVIVGAWWARNQQLYGDPLAMGAFTDAFKGSAQKSDIVNSIAASGDPSPDVTYWKDWIGWWTARSFFGTFGYMDIWLNESGHAINPQDRNTLYRLLMAGLGIAFLGWLLASLKKASLQKDWQIQTINGVFILVIIALFVRFNTQYFQAQARYVLPAIGPIACGVGIGVVFLCKEKWQAALAVVAGVLLAVNLYATLRLPSEFAKRIDAGRPNR